MGGVNENYSNFEVFTVRFLEAEGVIEIDINRMLVSIYGQNVFSQKEVAVSYNKLKVGQVALNDDLEKHRGRLGTSHSDENCVTVKGLIREDERAKVLEIAEVAGFAKKHYS
jgi:hypothetical protein